MLKIHQCYHKWKDVLFHDWIIFHCIILPHLLYPLIHWWALRMFRELLLLFLLFSQSVMSNSSRHHERQDGRLPCPEFTISQNLLKIMSIESMTPSNHLFLCYPLLLLWIFPSIGVFSNKLALCIKWSKYQSFSIRPLNEYSGLIILRTDWFDLLAVQGTLKVFSNTTLKKREFQKNIYFCFIDYAKAFDCVITINCGKFWKRWEYQTTWPFLEKPIWRSWSSS